MLLQGFLDKSAYLPYATKDSNNSLVPSIVAAGRSVNDRFQEHSAYKGWFYLN